MNKRSVCKLRDLIDAATAQIEDEIDRHKTGCGTISNEVQLTRFKATLTELRKELENESPNPKPLGIGRVIVDSWPFGTQLGKALLEIEQLVG